MKLVSFDFIGTFHRPIATDQIVGLSPKMAPRFTIKYRRKTLSDVTIGRRPVSDRNPACAILIKLETLSDGEVKICLLS